MTNNDPPRLSPVHTLGGGGGEVAEESSVPAVENSIYLEIKVFLPNENHG